MRTLFLSLFIFCCINEYYSQHLNFLQNSNAIDKFGSSYPIILHYKLTSGHLQSIKKSQKERLEIFKNTNGNHNSFSKLGLETEYAFKNDCNGPKLIKYYSYPLGNLIGEVEILQTSETSFLKAANLVNETSLKWEYHNSGELKMIVSQICYQSEGHPRRDSILFFYKKNRICQIQRYQTNGNHDTLETKWDLLYRNGRVEHEKASFYIKTDSIQKVLYKTFNYKYDDLKGFLEVKCEQNNFHYSVLSNEGIENGKSLIEEWGFEENRTCRNEYYFENDLLSFARVNHYLEFSKLEGDTITLFNKNLNLDYSFFYE
ncbi:MAG: hypothetical protein AB8F95_10270 [Bacteroidia bacterium]